jgi:chromosome partitioning protein
MAHVLAFAIQKGGTGKTASVTNLSPMFAERGARVLAVDLDPQANLTEGLGIATDSYEYSSYEVLLNPEQGTAFATIKTAFGVDLVPSTLDLAGAELELAAKIGREMLLAKALKKARDQYDYILLDPPPTLGFFTINALVAADAVIIPLQAHPDAYKALPKLEATIELVRELNPGLHIGGVFCTITDHTNVSQTIEEKAYKRYGDLMFKTKIPRNTALPEAKLANQPISLYAPRSASATAYYALVREIEERYDR